MRQEDLPLVAALEKSIYDFSWSLKHFADSLNSDDDCWVLILSQSPQDEAAKQPQERIIGHAVLTVTLDDATILNIAVHPDFQRRGLGMELLKFLLARAEVLKARHCFLEVRRSNVAAIALYEHAGFEEVGCRRDYYRAKDGREDALVLQLELSA